MSELVSPTAGLIVASFLYRHDLVELDKLLVKFEKRHRVLCQFKHPHFPMKDYYSKEMGPSDKLSRLYLLGLELAEREQLISEKIWADSFEKSSSPGGARAVNLDIGLLSLENLVLATGKNYVHRIYLGQGVYGDLTLLASDPKMVSLPWTYPDYSHSQVIDFFTWGRKILQHKLVKNKLV
ncbi:MAG: DUF4416 family protein [Halobacteriovoraceae bacterium]|jgi:hypothetical protein|nr:DUF4416 family protein [Halobacteriovoraceae bacterium]MBT5092869.1 DUF4416 family protein [Halobacteriovoraceae bacterium]